MKIQNTQRLVIFEKAATCCSSR